MNGDRLGKLLMEADIVTKRQLAQAVQKQMKGDSRKLGEILVEMGYVTVADLTEVMVEQANLAKSEGEKAKRDRLLQKQITKSKDKVLPKKEPVIVQPQPVQVKPKELSENTKFSLSIGTMIGIASGIASIVGLYWMLIGEIEEAKNLPDIKALYQAEYPSRPEGYNWPRSYEQYKDQVGSLQEDMDDAYDAIDEMKELLKGLTAEINSLERRKRDK
jgi:flagellar motility protein MotE (MotC chaperone)